MRGYADVKDDNYHRYDLPNKPHRAVCNSAYDARRVVAQRELEELANKEEDE